MMQWDVYVTAVGAQATDIGATYVGPYDELPAYLEPTVALLSAVDGRRRLISTVYDLPGVGCMSVHACNTFLYIAPEWYAQVMKEQGDE